MEQHSAAVISTLEECFETMTVHKVWIITEGDDDANCIREMLEERDYSIASDAMPSPAFLGGYDNTLITDWNTYANEQDAFRCILPIVDIVMLDGISDLNYAAWRRWTELSKGAGFYMKPSVQIYEV